MAIIWNPLILAELCQNERIWLPCHWQIWIDTFINGNHLKSAHFGGALPKWADLNTLPLTKRTRHFNQWQLFEIRLFWRNSAKMSGFEHLPLTKVTRHFYQWQLFEICSFWRSSAKMSGFENPAIDKSDYTLLSMGIIWNGSARPLPKWGIWKQGQNIKKN